MEDSKHWPDFHYKLSRAEKRICSLLTMTDDSQVQEELKQALEEITVFHHQKLNEYWKMLYGDLPSSTDQDGE